jgi:hypothetical protein
VKETDSPAAATITVVCAPDHLESTTDVAVTVTVGGSGTLAGAVYFPVASMVPRETLQTTFWLIGGLPNGPDTVALNCCTAPI